MGFSCLFRCAEWASERSVKPTFRPSRWTSWFFHRPMAIFSVGMVSQARLVVLKHLFALRWTTAPFTGVGRLEHRFGVGFSSYCISTRNPKCVVLSREAEFEGIIDVGRTVWHCLKAVGAADEPSVSISNINLQDTSAQYWKFWGPSNVRNSYPT